MKSKTIISITAIILCLTLLFAFRGALFNGSNNTQASFSEWKQDGVIQELVKYVSDVTNEKSENYIPVEDRIAVFDLDGTLVCEQFPIYFEWLLFSQRVLNDPSYESTPEMKEVAAEILNAGMTKSIPEDMEEKESVLFGVAFDGMRVDDYKQYVKTFLENEADGFKGLTLKDAYFRPMVQVLEYLEKNNFIVYICSGTDRDADRVMMSGFYPLPNYQVIGSDCYTDGENHDDVYYLDYQYDNGEQVMRDDTRIIKNVKSSKVMQMYQEIGQKPVLAFGNSSGDASMFSYTTSDNPYKSVAFCIVPDDNEREYAYPEKVEKLTKKCAENGWYVVSMKDDFLSMYGDNVTKAPENLTMVNSLMEKYQNSK